MSSEVEEFVQRHRVDGVVVDSQLMLLLLVGRQWPARITKFKRTRAYDLEAFQVLEAFLSQFQRIITTPNVMTEVSNLAGALDEESREQFFAYWRDVAGAVLADERYVESVTAQHRATFTRLGLTDSAIGILAGAGIGVLTDDLPLYVQLSRDGGHVMNFSHLRSRVWQE